MIAKSVQIKKPATILIVEDDVELKETISLMLEGHGYKVISASDGLEAYELITVQNINLDLIITDLNMPRMDGLELITKVMAIKPKMGVIFTSGHLEQFPGIETLNVKNSGFLPKPVSIKNLLGKINEVLDKVEFA
jgi:two-component system, cell cycle sensor histidine kinase and response regulator CckA